MSPIELLDIFLPVRPAGFLGSGGWTGISAASNPTPFFLRYLSPKCRGPYKNGSHNHVLWPLRLNNCSHGPFAPALRPAHAVAPRDCFRDAYQAHDEFLDRCLTHLLQEDSLLAGYRHMDPLIQKRERGFLLNSIKGFAEYLKTIADKSSLTLRRELSIALDNFNGFASPPA